MSFNVISPETSTDLCSCIKESRGKNVRFGAGYTDLLIELKQQTDDDLTVINLARMRDERFTCLQREEDGLRIGALVTAAMLCEDRALRAEFPVLVESAEVVGSRQIRRVATLGGNLCTASPAGDVAAALVALRAQCEILSASGATRAVPISGFLLGVRKTNLGADEILRSVLIPNHPGSVCRSRFIKVGTRRSMEIAVVSLACHLKSDEKGGICYAGVAAGSVAPTIRFADSACNFLLGKRLEELDEAEARTFAGHVLQVAEPISDIRASAWYRKQVLFNISRSILES